MKIATVDSKRRLVLPGAKPGESYGISQDEAGHYELIKVIPAPKPRPAPGEIDGLMKSAALTPRMSWDELRTLTRQL